MVPVAGRVVPAARHWSRGLLETELTAAGIPHDLKVYTGAKHSFFNDQWRNYESVAAADSWQRILAFFAEYVQRRPPSLA